MQRTMILLFLAACGTNNTTDTTGQQRSELTVSATCAAMSQPVPDEAWTCGETRTAECDNRASAPPLSLVFSAQSATTCAQKYKAVPAKASAPGTYTVEVRDDTTDALMCSGTLIVVDTEAPVLSAKNTKLWPPNHKLHAFKPTDCVDVSDACDSAVRLSFSYATSNEAGNAAGDGNTETDIVNLGCEGVELRAERAGSGASRVYRLGVIAEDKSGNKTTAECTVTVPHDNGKNKGDTPSLDVAYKIDAPVCR